MRSLAQWGAVRREISERSMEGATAAGSVMGSFSKEELRKLYSDDEFCAAEIAHAVEVLPETPTGARLTPR